MGQSVIGVRQALFAAALTLYTDPDVLVSYGDPGNYQPAVIVAIGQSRAAVTTPTMAPVRTTEQQVDTDVLISVYAAGGTEAQLAADLRAQAFSDQLRNYFRTSPNETLGGACRVSRVTAEMFDAEVIWQSEDGMDPVAAGRVSLATITISAFVRT